MSDNGGSDLDVFDNLSKDSSPARKQTLVGLAVPQAPGSSPRTSVPPPPPSLRASLPPAPPVVSEEEAEEIEEVEAVEEVSSPLAAGSSPVAAEDESAEEDIYDEEDATQVFSGFGPSDDEEPTAEPPTPIAAPASSSASSSLPLPPPPPPTGLSSGPPPPPSVTSTGASLPPPPNILRSSGPPPPPPTPTPAAGSAPDWDETDEDKTTVFSRESGFDAAHMLMGRASPGSVPVGSVPDVPPPPMSRPSAPVPSPPVVSMPSGQRTSYAEVESVPPAPANRTPLVFGAIAAIVLGVALFFILRPTTGGLVVTVAGPGNKAINGVEVVVDGKVVCKASPCTLGDLEAGTHMVKARAEGFAQTAETAVLVSGGQDAVKNIVLSQASGTGIRVTGTGQGLRLFVDGEDKGPLPQELKQMSPGVHQIKVSGEHFDTWEKSVTVREEEMENIEVPKLEVVKGLAIIKGGMNSNGARIVLESDGDRRVLPSLPMNLHIDTSKPHTLVATRKGYETFREDLTFEDGQAEKTFEISLDKISDNETTDAPRTTPKWRPKPSPSPAPTPKASGGDALLNLNSIPASNVLLDGRPVGRTPKLGVKVSPGPHTVVFVHEGKRANKSVNAKAGQTSTVVHRFQ